MMNNFHMSRGINSNDIMRLKIIHYAGAMELTKLKSVHYGFLCKESLSVFITHLRRHGMVTCRLNGEYDLRSLELTDLGLQEIGE